MEDFRLIGPELLLGKIFDEIGFNPPSLSASADEKDMVKFPAACCGNTSPELALGFIPLIRQRGFSKDGKHQQPQILLGLLVSAAGYPLSYELFESSTFEGHTIVPVIESFKEKYRLQKVIVVTDAGMVSEKNIQAICEKGYEFIVGAQLNMSRHPSKKRFWHFKLRNKESRTIDKNDGQKLMVSYSAVRARNDAYNRKRGLNKLAKALQSGQLTKKHINQQGV